MSKHTPGPWRVDTYPEVHVKNKDGGVICFAELRNARLIAAAPELLTACHWALANALYDESEGAALPHETIERLRIAIAKAEGRGSGER